MSFWLNQSLKESSKQKIAIFADRDGTLIKHVDYLGDPQLVELHLGVKQSVQRILKEGMHFFLFSNQSGVARGYFNEETVNQCNQQMFELLGINKEELSGICIATGLPESNDVYRKPSPRFINEALEYFEIESSNAHIIGDALVDLQAGNAAAINTWLVGSGKKEAVIAHEAKAIHLKYNFCEDFSSCMEALIYNNFTFRR